MSVSENLLKIRSKIPANVSLVVVSKTHPSHLILEAYEVGQRAFGENRVQELLEKQRQLPKDIEWHLIGHLQSNKVKQVIGKLSLIHSIDSISLLEEIEKQAAKANRIQPILLQVFIAQEDTKFGFDADEIKTLWANGFLRNYPHIQVKGLMGMATNTDNSAQVIAEFEALHQLFEEIKKTYKNADFNILSMGMSSDWELAVQEGSTLIRVGSSIFGSR